MSRAVVDYKIPFYENTADNLHCCQASMKMIQEYFIPDLGQSFEDWDVITAHKPNLYTWTMAGLMWFKSRGFEVLNIEGFDYKLFLQKGGEYLVDYFGREVGETQIKFSDISQEMKIAQKFVREISSETRLPSFSDIEILLSQGYLIICNINACALYGENGYSGHLVVVKGYTEDRQLILNDPGLPGKEDACFGYGQFYKAWAFPNEQALNLSAVRLQR